jgi:transcriptional regulator with XRE-family HTH domain
MDKWDMKAFGQAVKSARENRGMSREELAEIIDLTPKYVMYIEMRGQHTSLQRLYVIARLFNISIDEYFFPDASESKTTLRRQLDATLDDMDNNSLAAMTAVGKALQEAIKTASGQNKEQK